VSLKWYVKLFRHATKKVVYRFTGFGRDNNRVGDIKWAILCCNDVNNISCGDIADIKFLPECKYGFSLHFHLHCIGFVHV
jgi:hypothetical protein